MGSYAVLQFSDGILLYICAMFTASVGRKRFHVNGMAVIAMKVCPRVLSLAISKSTILGTVGFVRPVTQSSLAKQLCTHTAHSATESS